MFPLDTAQSVRANISKIDLYVMRAQRPLTDEPETNFEPKKKHATNTHFYAVASIESNVYAWNGIYTGSSRRTTVLKELTQTNRLPSLSMTTNRVEVDVVANVVTTRRRVYMELFEAKRNKTKCCERVQY